MSNVDKRSSAASGTPPTAEDSAHRSPGAAAPEAGRSSTTAADRAPDGFLAKFHALVGAEEIIEAGARLGVVQRRRKIDLPALVEGTILAMLPIPGTQTTALANYLSITGQSLAPSSFYDRFTDEFAALMKEVAGRALAAVRETNADDVCTRDLGVLLENFSDVRVADSTSHTLRKLARAWAPATSTVRPAGVKFHTVISLRDDLPVADEITPQRTHDNRAYPEVTLEPGTLSLFDLGYIDSRRFIRAIERGAHFLTRLKSSHNPEVVRVFVGSGSRRQARGLPLDEALATGVLKPEKGVIDIDARIRAKGQEAIVRVVAVIDSENDDLHWYLTSVDRNILDPLDVAEAYRIRWVVELFFKQLKSGTGLDGILSWRRSAVTALIYAKVIALCLSRLLEHSVRLRDPDKGHVLARLALVLVLTRAAPLLLTYIYMRRGITVAQLEERILLIATIAGRARNRRRERERMKREAALGRHDG